MAHIVYCWELGGGYGHLDRMQQIGSALEALGHRITYVVRDPVRAELRFRRKDSSLLQAPFYIRHGGPLQAAINYSDVLLRCGYKDAGELSGLVKPWLQIFQLSKAELALVDSAPTALLAARLAGIPASAAENAFFSPPPDMQHTPSLQPWKQIMSSQLLETDRAALHSINQVCRQNSAQPLQSVTQLVDIKLKFLCTFAEMDHYGIRPNENYYGPIFEHGGEPFQAWAEHPGQKIFLYLSAAHKQFRSLIEQLKQSPYQVLIHARDISWQHRKQSIDKNLYISPSPVEMKQVLAHAQLLICHANLATCSSALLAGIPLINLPQQTEQMLLGYRLAEHQLGVLVDPNFDSPDWISIIEKTLASEDILQAAQAFRKRYRAYDVQQSCQRIAQAIGHL